jgi:hypothetical protein
MAGRTTVNTSGAYFTICISAGPISHNSCVKKLRDINAEQNSAGLSAVLP